jgi:hypothetical protein
VYYHQNEGNLVTLKRKSDGLSLLSCPVNEIDLPDQPNAFATYVDFEEFADQNFFKAAVSGGGGGGSTDVSALNKESTQTLVKNAVVALQNAINNDPATATHQTEANTLLTAIKALFPQALNADGGFLSHITNDIATGAKQDALKALFPQALNADGGFLVHMVNVLLGQKTMAASQPVVIASDQSAVPHKIKTPDAITASTQSAVSGGILYQDVSAYQYVSFMLMGNGVGSVRIQQSNDSSNWFTSPYILSQTNKYSQDDLTNANLNQTAVIPVLGKYMRVIVQTITSGGFGGSAWGMYNELPLSGAKGKNVKTYTDLSLTGTGADVQVIAANAAGYGVEVYNPSDTVIWANYDAPAVANGQGSFPIQPNGYYESELTNALHLLVANGKVATVKRY